MQKIHSRPYRQQGVALITIMLIFTIVTVMVTSAVSRGSLDIRRTSFLLSDSQAFEYALGGEALARQWLYEDLMGENRQPHDHTGERWYQANVFEPELGRIRLVIRDMESRFNLNNLVDSEGKTNSEALATLRNLLNELQLNPDLAIQLADWIDSNQNPQTFDSEDTHFLGQEPAYRSADQHIADTSELLSLGRLTKTEWQTLEPFITSVKATTLINPNTASATILSSLNSKLDGSKVVNERESKESGFTTVEEFMAADSTAGVELKAETFSVTSEYFEVWTHASFTERNLYLRSQLHRDRTSGTITLLGRSLQRPPKLIRERLQQLDSQVSDSTET
ncbi:GspK family T2SS minor pseudopilin variant XcpX [Maricurvus nonylphenolicus]|uniref:type II secretion system minor pseudopilin GspK n=1 Tax=Maricurvus nonylphenolicus TaxID=1008307 RepID=UPI0036F3F111